MKPRAFIPFDPDAISAADRAHIKIEPAHAGVPMLSQVIDSIDWHGDGAPAPAAHAEKGTAQPLSKRQKWILSDLAEAVYDYLRAGGEVQGERLDAYRQRIAIAACGSRISQASHGHFKLIQAAFLKERGRVEEARRALAQAAATPKAIALHKLWELCSNNAIPPAYVHTLARRFYRGAELEQITARQVWTLFYTIQNNLNKAAGKGSDANRFKSRQAKQRQGRKHA